jgi:hypothetical protein
VSGEVVILEEAAYCDQGMINEVVVPLLSMSTSVLLGISTLLDGSNHYSKMIKLKKPSGEPVFESMAITLVCDACMKTEHPERCKHKLSEVPRWISSEKVSAISDKATLAILFLYCVAVDQVEVVRTLLAEDPAMLLRESLGISADGSEKMYRGDDVEAFNIRVPDALVWQDRDHRLNVQHIFIAVDPSGGGPSAFSICSTIMMPNGSIQVRLAPLLLPNT